jgi:hypothetical protein
MKRLIPALLAASACARSGQSVSVWEKQEIVFTARQKHVKPYLDVDVWIDLRGPNFHKRVYGFWDGGNIWRVRYLAVTPGDWSWTSGANIADPGFQGRTGSFRAVPWPESDKQANPNRRGFLRATPDGHALEYADGTEFFLLGDTWWAAPTHRLRWTEDDTAHPMGPQATFKDYVRFRKAQGFNSVAILAAFPHWANDGQPATIVLDDAEKTPIRSAWAHPAAKSSKDMSNSGGRAFEFPGRVPGFENIVPDLEHINPAYFRELDKKLDYLNAQGVVPFLEIARRDIILVWKKFYPWPDSYTRYMQYVFNRYQANSTILSPIHYDSPGMTIPAREFNPIVNDAQARYGAPPFGTLLSTNSSPSTLVNFGKEEDARWVTLHQTGNQREHEFYWHHTEIFHSPPARPSVSGEPYYAGWLYKPGEELPYTAEGGSERDNRFCRSAMYGNFLSGAFGGHIYGAEGIWQGAIEPEAAIKIWDAIQWRSSAQMQQFKQFVFSRGKEFQRLVPCTDRLSPNSNSNIRAYEGWSFAARSPRDDWFLIYREKGTPPTWLRSIPRERSYQARWFNPRTGEWSDAGLLKPNTQHRIALPKPPTDDDWALSLTLAP